jgi:hypothetical protein
MNTDTGVGKPDGDSGEGVEASVSTSVGEVEGVEAEGAEGAAGDGARDKARAWGKLALLIRASASRATWPVTLEMQSVVSADDKLYYHNMSPLLCNNRASSWIAASLALASRRAASFAFLRSLSLC